MHSDRTAVRSAPQPPPFNPFTLTDVEVAEIASNEYDSSRTDCSRSRESGNHCAKCGVFEQCGGDMNYEGTRSVAVLSENLTNCKTCTDCVMHPACAQDGLCPHCAYMEGEKKHAEFARDSLTETRLVDLKNDSRQCIKDLLAETNDAKAMVGIEILNQVWEPILIAVIEKRDEIRSRHAKAA